MQFAAHAALESGVDQLMLANAGKAGKGGRYDAGAIVIAVALTADRVAMASEVLPAVALMATLVALASVMVRLSVSRSICVRSASTSTQQP